MICGDLKALSMLPGQHFGYTKYPCFMCEWDSLQSKKLTLGTKSLDIKDIS
jgi:hypothetical protein